MCRLSLRGGAVFYKGPDTSHFTSLFALAFPSHM